MAPFHISVRNQDRLIPALFGSGSHGYGVTERSKATFLGSGAADVGRWWKNLQVSGAVVDVFVLRFGKPVVSHLVNKRALQ
eukprot:103743-Amphidinium_carterae.1